MPLKNECPSRHPHPPHYVCTLNRPGPELCCSAPLQRETEQNNSINTFYPLRIWGMQHIELDKVKSRLGSKKNIWRWPGSQCKMICDICSLCKKQSALDKDLKPSSISNHDTSFNIEVMFSSFLAGEAGEGNVRMSTQTVFVLNPEAAAIYFINTSFFWNPKCHKDVSINAKQLISGSWNTVYYHFISLCST